MMMTATKPLAENGPDDLCGVCDTTRENHGDMNHVFSIDGNLQTLPQRPHPRQQPPREKGEKTHASLSAEASAISRDPVTSMSLRLIERLIAKNILNGEDLLIIFGGETHGNS